MASEAPEISCVSLGMVILDEIRMPNKTPMENVIGGSASFMTLGSRIFAQEAAKVGCLLVAGRDFPTSVESRLRQWGTTLVVQKHDSAPSTRGFLEYQDDTFGPKQFRYTTPPLKAAPKDLVGTQLLHAKAVHFFATPHEIEAQVPELLRLRHEQGVVERPLIVWEPFPAACQPSNRQAFLDACKIVDVFSPNHLELLGLFGEETAESRKLEQLEGLGTDIVDSSIGPEGQGTLVIRAGENGCLVSSPTTRPTWFPPFYDDKSTKIVDPTGAGNAFLGGYIAGWQATNSEVEAVWYGHVAASFALEQIGLPKLETKDHRDVWNGDAAMDRLTEYKTRIMDRAVKSENVL
ncbi:pfkB family kinase [Polyplosphaeria fusca]|uniref:PfkB family kinase n=1 Tax=Polyplosphaeria fusca TaxID=682080 RepID=A0A9P4QY28_9PLEO|nr:pfkB family kinase [Polyplosphaeria fusca]